MAQIEVDPIFGPHVVADYTVRSRRIIRPGRTLSPYIDLVTQNGLTCIVYKTDRWLDIDMLDLESRVMKYLRVRY